MAIVSFWELLALFCSIPMGTTIFSLHHWREKYLSTSCLVWRMLLSMQFHQIPRHERYAMHSGLLACAAWSQYHGPLQFFIPQSESLYKASVSLLLPSQNQCSVVQGIGPESWALKYPFSLLAILLVILFSQLAFSLLLMHCVIRGSVLYSSPKQR